LVFNLAFVSLIYVVFSGFTSEEDLPKILEIKMVFKKSHKMENLK